MQQLAASQGAFAALRLDGSVITWGDADYGGDSRDLGWGVGWGWGLVGLGLVGVWLGFGWFELVCLVGGFN